MSKQFLSKAAVRLALVVTFILLIAMGIVGYEARIEYEVNRRANSLEVEPKFTQQHLATTLHLYDLGVVDVDNDDQLDIYTVNHSARQSLLINDPNGFADQLLELGLTQNLEFPGIEPSTYLPPVEASGLYLYWNKGNLVIQAHNIDNFALVNGQIRLPQAAFVKSKANFQVSTSKSDDQLIVKFAAQGNGQLIFGTRSYYFVPEFELDEQLSLEEVYIGLGDYILRLIVLRHSQAKIATEWLGLI